MSIFDPSNFSSLKGEFEAEGLTRDEIAAEALFAARHSLNYLVKIGGCEAKSDAEFLQRAGITSIVAPMIESAFAMKKYMGILPVGVFPHVGVTIETVTAVDRIEAILDAGTKLTHVTVGRTDLTASYDGDGVDSERTMEMVKTTLRAARARGLGTTIGGSVSTKTRSMLQQNAELRGLIDSVETRKAVMPTAKFIEVGALESAIAIELDLLEIRAGPLAERANSANSRVSQVRARL